MVVFKIKDKLTMEDVGTITMTAVRVILFIIMVVLLLLLLEVLI